MPRYQSSEPREALLAALADALDTADFGIALLDRDLRVRWSNPRFAETWNLQPATTPTFRALLDRAAASGRIMLPPDDRPAYLDAREGELRNAGTASVRVGRLDRRPLMLRCSACADGGRILACIDMSGELEHETAEAVAAVSAELRFNAELLEEQGAHLANLAEEAAENAHQAEAARLMLEREVAERRHLETKLRHLATTDGLTGALNRAELLASGQRMIEAGLAAGRTVAVLMLDVDHFKTINDRFGHAGGDHALRHLVTVLRAGTRQDDLLGRLGGEEFAIVLPDTSTSLALTVAERLRARVAETPAMFGAQRIPMTVSVGLAIQAEAETAIEQLIARADDALYRAKRGGRNRVIRDSSPQAA
ncbi:MAG TPA: diguanylate cyclase [Rhodopila sp.]|nr:diguanylate cyclase [Rhodopila sp.]